MIAPWISFFCMKCVTAVLSLFHTAVLEVKLPTKEEKTLWELNVLVNFCSNKAQLDNTYKCWFKK